MRSKNLQKEYGVGLIRMVEIANKKEKCQKCGGQTMFFTTKAAFFCLNCDFK